MASATAPTLLVVAANARSLVANRGDLITAVRAAGWRVVALVPRADYLSSVEELGIEIRTFDLARASLNPVADLRSLLQIARHVRELRPEVVFGYSAKPVIYGAIAARLAKRRARIGSMITGLGYAFSTDSLRSRVAQAVMIALYRVAVACSDVVFVQNPDDEALLRQRGILRERTTVVRTAGSGVNLERFALAPAVTSPLTFTMVGRMLEDKGIREFIVAARRVKALHPDVRIVLIAPSNDALPRSVPREEAEAAAAEGALEYVPGVADVRPQLAQTSVLVLPSYREGTPRSVLEAMAMGRAVITSDAPGCRETVEEGRNGLLVPVRDAEALADAMARFAREPGLAERMGAEGRRLAAERFDVLHVNRTIMQALGMSEEGRGASEATTADRANQAGVPGWKRACDLVLALPVALVLLPVLALVALAVRLESPGPVLFRQTRLGRDQRPYTILKFRTMHDRDPNAIDQVRERVVSAGHDPRITRVGRVLRATSLDELPQVWNVLIGDMSLVGPRPVLPEQLEAIPDRLRARFRMPPGITGLAQVRGRRSLDWLQVLEADAEYAREASLELDLRLLLRTVLVVLRREGIYGGEGENWRTYLARVRAEATEAEVGPR